MTAGKNRGTEDIQILLLFLKGKGNRGRLKQNVMECRQKILCNISRLR